MKSYSPSLSLSLSHSYTHMTSSNVYSSQFFTLTLKWARFSDIDSFGLYIHETRRLTQSIFDISQTHKIYFVRCKLLLLTVFEFFLHCLTIIICVSPLFYYLIIDFSFWLVSSFRNVKKAANVAENLVEKHQLRKLTWKPNLVTFHSIQNTNFNSILQKS